jgi:hypothetical protein
MALTEHKVQKETKVIPETQDHKDPQERTAQMV